MSSAINSNLSELDQLLQDLNSAQFMDEVNRRNATNQPQMVNGSSQRIISAPVPPSPTSVNQPNQPMVAPKPTRIEGGNRVHVDALLHELENAVPPPLGPPPALEMPFGAPSPPLPPFPMFLNMEGALLKQGMHSTPSDGNYSFQSSETVSSSKMTTTTSSTTDETTGAFPAPGSHPMAFAPLNPPGVAPIVSEQKQSSSSQSYSKVESSESSEVVQQSEQSTMEKTEKYEVSSSSSQQHTPPQPTMMAVNKGLMFEESNLPPFPVHQNYESRSEHSHIYKKIERNEPAQNGSPQLPRQQHQAQPQVDSSNTNSFYKQDMSSAYQELHPSQNAQQYQTSVSEQQEQQSQTSSEHHESVSSSNTFESRQSLSSKERMGSSSIFGPPSPAPPFPCVYLDTSNNLWLQQLQNSGDYDLISDFCPINYGCQNDDYDLANSEEFQWNENTEAVSAEPFQNSFESQSRQSAATSSQQQHHQQEQQQHHQQEQQQQQQQQMASQSYVHNAYPQQPLYQEKPMQPPQTASTATRELDELMASLSEFRVTNRDIPTQQVAGGDPAYARPHKLRNTAEGTSSSSSSSVSHMGGNVVAQGDHLDSMLGSLQSDMNRQGVSTKAKGLCAACNKPVVSQMITALGKVWHVEHFTCAHCNMTLGTMSFYEREGKAYCETDYHSLFAPRCAYCNGPIVDKCVTALDKTWHPEHFFCGLCGRNFGDEGFHERDGQAYCREDYLKMFAPKCGGCVLPIKDSYISALNRHWHPECFVCWDCQMPFGNMSFFDHDGLPYCEQHYHAKRGSLCAECGQPITGPSIIAMGRKFHPKHFACAFCRKQLNNVTFKEQNDKPYCHPCFSKLFAGTKMMD